MTSNKSLFCGFYERLTSKSRLCAAAMSGCGLVFGIQLGIHFGHSIGHSVGHSVWAFTWAFTLGIHLGIQFGHSVGHLLFESVLRNFQNIAIMQLLDLSQLLQSL